MTEDNNLEMRRIQEEINRRMEALENAIIERLNLSQRATDKLSETAKALDEKIETLQQQIDELKDKQSQLEETFEVEEETPEEAEEEPSELDPPLRPPGNGGNGNGGNGNGRGRIQPTPVQLVRGEAPPTYDQTLWSVIRNRTRAIGFPRYKQFIDRVLAGNADLDNDPKTPKTPRAKKLERQFRTADPYQGVDIFNVLKEATELFLLSEMGVVPYEPETMQIYIKEMVSRFSRFIPSSIREELIEKLEEDAHYTDIYDTAQKVFGSLDVNGPPGYKDGRIKTFSGIREEFVKKLGRFKVLPYLDRITSQLSGLELKNIAEMPLPYYGILPQKLTRPLLIELIWSYWHEQGMLTQSIKHVTLRFQNKLVGRDNPLAHFELDPLRSANNFLWGYIQNEVNMLTVNRRNHEYGHEYGLNLTGKAVARGTVADRRSRFLQSFHHLLHQCTEFFMRDDDTTVVSDAFPVLNCLKEVHLLLTKGAHNQYGDLPWTSRVEMLMEQYILGQPALREFLGGRIMVDYPENWMMQVDGMRSIMGWGDSSIVHFNNLATFGEQILLSIRWRRWSSENNPDTAKNWAQYWRPEIQGYVHAYHAVTGVDLAGTLSQPLRIDSTQPMEYLRRQRRPRRVR